MKVAIYDREKNKVEYYNVQKCFTSSIIDTQFELINVKTSERLSLIHLHHEDDYAINHGDLIKLLIYIDKEFQDNVVVEKDWEAQDET